MSVGQRQPFILSRGIEKNLCAEKFRMLTIPISKDERWTITERILRYASQSSFKRYLQLRILISLLRMSGSVLRSHQCPNE